MIDLLKTKNLFKNSAAALAGLLVTAGLYLSSMHSFLLFHNFVEIISAVVYVLIFVIAWYSRRVLDNQYLLIIGMASLPLGIIVLGHTLAYESMQLFPGYDTELSMQLWIVFRYLQGAAFLAAPLFLNRRVRAAGALTIFSLAAAALVIAVFLGKFPSCYDDNTGMTPFKVFSEYAVSVALLLAFVLLYREHRAFDRGVHGLLSVSILAALLSTVSYTQHVTVIDMTNMAGHFFELLASYLLFKAVVVTGVVKPSDLLFRNLKLSEEAARESEERYRSLVELSPEAIAVHCEGRYLYVNPAGLTLFGARDAGDLIGRSVLDFVPPAFRPIVDERMRRSYDLRLQAPLREARILRVDGREVDVEAASTPITYSGKPATQVVIRDITDRKCAEEALRRANEELEQRVRERTRELHAVVESLKREITERTRLASAVASSTDAVLITDVRGIILYVNRAFEQMTGYNEYEVAGGTIPLLDDGRHTEEYFVAVQEQIARSGSWSGRLIGRKKNGERYHEECSLFAVRGQDGTIVNYVALKRDVTEKLRLESIAEAATTMNNIGYIISGISHEIGNPVSALLVNLDLMKTMLDVAPREKLGEYVERSLSQVSKIDYLLNSLRVFNMFEVPEPRLVDLASFLDQFHALVAPDFRKKGIDIEKDWASGGMRVHADPRALQQVMLNIFTNAADALERRPNPRIVVRTTQNGSRRTSIRVEDNGCGMTNEQQKNLFKPFYTNKPHGTGLGMVIIKNMLTRMNGTIEVSSREQEGTAVVLTLPEADDEHERSE